MKALFIPVDPMLMPSERELPDDGGRLKAMQEAVGGWIECVHLADPEPQIPTGADLWLNEEGKLLGLPPNFRATLLAIALANLMPGDYIVGDCLLTGGPDGEGNCTDCPPELLAAMPA